MITKFANYKGSKTKAVAIRITLKFSIEATKASQITATKLYTLLYLWITIIEIISMTLNEKSEEFKNLIAKFNPFRKPLVNLRNLPFLPFFF
jgi:hypothetical protein